MSETKKYLLVMLSVAVGAFALLWVFTCEARLGFADEDFGIWKAKLELVDRCDLGDPVILGDSRAAMGFIPRILGGDATNLAFAGSTPIEGYFLVRRMIRCAHHPRLVILSYSPFQFEHADWLWAKSARDGLLSYNDLEDIRKRERVLSPGFLYVDSFGQEPPGNIKNWLYAAHFPAFDFASLIRAGLLGRWRSNATEYVETKAQRGYHAAKPLQDCALAAPPDLEAEFRPQRTIDAYFGEMLDALRSAGIAVAIIQTPISQITARALNPAFKREYADYIIARAAGPYVAVSADRLFPELGNCDFRDDVHLNHQGATAFSSAALGELRRLGLTTGESLQAHTLGAQESSATGIDASRQ
jgi:hypothetical protein